MPAVWFALKRSLRCKSEQRDVYDPKDDGGGNKLSKISTTRSRRGGGRSVCSKSIENLKDVVIHGSIRHTEKPAVCSPRSIGSSELLNPITHEVVLNSSTCELKVSAGFKEGGGVGVNNGVSNFVGMLKPGTPTRTGFYVVRGQMSGFLGSPIRRTASSLSGRSSEFVAVSARPRSSFGSDWNGALFCHKCHESFVRWEDVEEHHLSKHAVTELIEGDSSRKIVEIICRAGSSRLDNPNCGIERILKVDNMQKTLAQFEEYRELIKIKASKHTKKHPRCLADGNELLRFHGAVLECSLGVRGSCNLCTFENCRVCRILRYGFSTKRELQAGGVGVFTASTSSRAFESLQEFEGNINPCMRKALVVCRVIAGRVHRPLENMHDMVGQSGFDSLAGKVGVHSNIEELYLLSPRALLPCFVVIYKP